MDPQKKPPKRLDNSKVTPVPWSKRETELLENISIRPLDTIDKNDKNDLSLAQNMKIQLADFERLITDEGEKKALESLRFMRGSKTPEIGDVKSAPIERINNITVKSPPRNPGDTPQKRVAINKHQHRNLYQIVHGSEEGIFEPSSPNMNLSKEIESRLLEHKKYTTKHQGSEQRYSVKNYIEN